MWRRIHVIEFPRKFAEHEMDVELTEKLMGELSGIFNWALEGYKRLDGQKFIFSERLILLIRIVAGFLSSIFEKVSLMTNT